MNSKDYNLFAEAYAAVYSEQATTVTSVPPAGDSLRTGSNKAPKAPKLPKPTKEDVDLYNLMKGYLIDEGFADDEKAALAIMANMSEQWKESIVEIKMPGKATSKNKTTKVAQSTPADRARRAVQNQRDGYHGDDDALNKGMEALKTSMGRLKGV